MERRGFLRLLGLGLALGPDAIAEAMKPRIFYSIPASLTGPPVTPEQIAIYDNVLRTVYEGKIRELITQPSLALAEWHHEFIRGRPAHVLRYRAPQVELA